MVGRTRAAAALAAAAALVSLGLATTLAASAPATAASLPPVGPGLITASSQHTCAVSAAGAATCWGSGSYGQLGTSLSDDAATPEPVFEWQSGVEAIDAGQTLTCGVIGGGAKCWGYGPALGHGTTRNYGVPVSVLGLDAGVSDLGVGNSSACAVKDGNVSCWGEGGRGRLGNGSTADAPAPVSVSGLPGPVGSIAIGEQHGCAVTVDGQVWCWGSNVYGQLGDGSTNDSSVAVQVTGLPTDIREVTAASRHTCAATWSGDVWCWGNNANGQLGDGTNTASPTAIEIGGITGDVESIDAGGSDTCAVTTGHDLWCWGANSAGQVGNYTTTDARSPVAITGISSVARIAVGGGHTCAVTTSGEISCWGSNTNGKLGQPTPATTVVQPVRGLSANVTAVDAGNAHSCAIVSGGARCWGDNAAGQLGITGPAVSATPVAVTGLGSGVSAISAGTSFTCAVVDGAAKCWGTNTNGQLGNGTNTASSTPVTVNGLGSGVTAISAGTSHACAIKDGGVWCWGLGSGGQLGSGTASSNVPVAVPQLDADATEVDAGATTACAVRSGAVWCWGSGAGTGRGQSGNPAPGTVTNMGSGSTSITTGTSHSCAANGSGGARCWGAGTFYQLGIYYDGVVTNPVGPADFQSGVTSLSAAGNKTCAIKADAVSCWGNTPIILQNGGPQLIAGLGSGATDVTVGTSHQCAVRDGGAWCWGSNAKGELGNGIFGPNGGISLDPPTILEQPHAAAAVEGSTVSFVATAAGSPAPTVQWQRSDDDGQTWDDIDGADATTLSFPATLADHGARFRAVFTNDLGTATSDAAVLTVGGGVPGAPGTPTARAGDGEAIVSWSAPADDGGSPITGYRVTPYIGSEAQEAKTFTGTATTHTVTGLANGAEHHFVVTALNAAGSGPASAASNDVWVHGGLPQVSVGDVRISEAAGVAQVEVSLSKPGDVPVRVRTSAGSAGSDDFTAVDQTVTFSADGPLTATVDIPIANDSLKESTESFSTVLTASGSKAVMADANGKVTIDDDDGLPALLTVEDVASAPEGGEAVFQVMIRGTVDADVTVPYATSPSTASAGDFTATSGSVAFTAGEVDPVRTVSVPITDDTTAEGPESFTLALTAPAGVTAADTAARGWIPANDGGTGAVPSAPRVRVDDVRTTEGSGPASVVVRIDQSAAASVVLTANGSTATPGDDFAAGSTTVTFTPGGPTAIEVPIAITDDANPEFEEKFNLGLKSAVGATIADPTATATVLDDDGLPPQLRISDAIGQEGGDAAFLVSLRGPLTQDVTVELSLASGTATAGSDFGDLDVVTVTFPAGSVDPRRVVRVPLTADGVDEPGRETFTLKGAAAGTTITIADAAGKGTITD